MLFVKQTLCYGDKLKKRVIHFCFVFFRVPRPLGLTFISYIQQPVVTLQWDFKNF